MKRQKHPLGESLREMVFGVNDGAIGNLGVVIGLAQATASNRIIILAGLATMFAQMISMSSGNYLSVKSEKEYFNRRGKSRNFGKEYVAHKDPLLSSVVMALAVMFGTAIPLIPFFFLESVKGIVPAIVITLFTLFFIGVAKTHFTRKSWLTSGLEMLFIGSSAALAGYLIGTVFAV